MGTRKPSQVFIAPSALVDTTARIGKGTKVWAFAQVAEHARIGKDCVIGNGVYIDRHVRVGNRVRIHNKALLYHGIVIEDDVFIGPGVCFINDPWPRSGCTRDLRGKSWKVSKGASIGANATVLPDLRIGKYAVVGAGSVVTRNVADHCVVYGNPARVMGLICRCGQRAKPSALPVSKKAFVCKSCSQAMLRRRAKGS